jgi:hypothetical protein
MNQPVSPPPDAHHHTERRAVSMASNDTVMRKYARGQSPSGDRAAAAPVRSVVWCRSEGTSWTLELHELGREHPTYDTHGVDQLGRAHHDHGTAPGQRQRARLRHRGFVIHLAGRRRRRAAVRLASPRPLSAVPHSPPRQLP